MTTTTSTTIFLGCDSIEINLVHFKFGCQFFGFLPHTIFFPAIMVIIFQSDMFWLGVMRHNQQKRCTNKMRMTIHEYIIKLSFDSLITNLVFLL